MVIRFKTLVISQKFYAICGSKLFPYKCHLCRTRMVVLERDYLTIAASLKVYRNITIKVKYCHQLPNCRKVN